VFLLINIYISIAREVAPGFYRCSCWSIFTFLLHVRLPPVF